MKTEHDLTDVITKKEISQIDKRDKEIMVKSMKKLVEDLDMIDLIFSSMDLKPEQTLRMKQFITNNKARARKVIWGLTLSMIKDSDEVDNISVPEEIEQHNQIMEQEEDDYD